MYIGSIDIASIQSASAAAYLNKMHHQVHDQHINKYNPSMFACTLIYIFRELCYMCNTREQGNKSYNFHQTFLYHISMAAELLRSGSKRHSLHTVELSQRSGNPRCKLCQPLLPQKMGARFTVFGKPAMQTRWLAGMAPHKSGRCRD